MPSNKFIVTVSVLFCVLIIVFESAQQFYFVTLYNIGDSLQFNNLLKNQVIKWALWLVFSIPVIAATKRIAYKNAVTEFDIGKQALFIVFALFCVILTSSAVFLLIAETPFTWVVFWGDYVVFLTYQKFPIFSIGYVFTSLAAYFYFRNSELQNHIVTLTDLNKQQQNPNDQSTKSNTGLRIKVGNQYKIISTDEIQWIEADDYCVNVHIANDAVYSMRSTLKSLEATLPTNFIRVHRSAIVNTSSVVEYKSKGAGLITLKNGTEISISQSKLKQVSAYFSS